MKAKFINESINDLNISQIFNKVEQLWPMYDWISYKKFYDIQYGEDNFTTDLDTVYGIEEDALENVFNNEKNDCYVLDTNVSPEIEICFESEEEVFCHVYTDKKGNIRSCLLDID